MRLSILIIICGFCTLQFASAQDEGQFVYFSDDIAYQEYWGKDSSDPSNPYVLWLELELNNKCKLPVYRTGYPTGWAVIKGFALQAGVKEVEIKFCGNVPGRCYMTDLNWMGKLDVVGFDKENSCNSKLTYDRWQN